jgi:hypothetical protein
VSINSVLIYTAIRAQEKRNARYLGARLQCEGQSTSTTPVYSSVSGSHQNFGVGLEDAESEQEMAVVVQEKGNDKGNDILMKNEFDAKSSTVKTTENKEIESSDQALKEESKEVQCPGNEQPTVSSLLTSRKTVGVQSTKKVKQSRIAAVQSLLYVGSALFTAVWVLMPWLGNKLDLAVQWRFFFAFMVNIVSPSQGVFSLFVFVRLQYLRLRETNKDWSRLRCVKECLFSLD